MLTRRSLAPLSTLAALTGSFGSPATAAASSQTSPPQASAAQQAGPATNLFDARYVNDNQNEVDSADIADGSLTGADVSTSAGDVTFGGGATVRADRGIFGVGSNASGPRSVVSGGVSNAASGNYGTVSGGGYNAASNPLSTVSGGFGNSASGEASTISGGYNNSASNFASVVAGGFDNEAVGLLETVSGGYGNQASGDVSTVSGGGQNVASGRYSSVAGGRKNGAYGQYSFAAGRQAKANHDGSFVWGDGREMDKHSSMADEFNIYAEGGLRMFAAGQSSPSWVVSPEGEAGIGTATPARALHVRSAANGVVRIDRASANPAVEFNRFPDGDLDSPPLQTWQTGCDASGFFVAQSGVGTRMYVDDAGNVGVGTDSPTFKLEVNGSAGKPGGGSWSVASDRRLKKDIDDLEDALDTLLALRGVTFEYKDPEAINELSGARIGFVAQEVERVLPDWVEEVDGYKRLSVRGFEALTVEALRELEQRSECLRARDDELAREATAKDARIRELGEQVTTLQERVAGLEALRGELHAALATVREL